MSYHRKPPALGDVSSVVTTAASVMADPYFNEAVCRIQQLRAIENKTAVSSCSKTRPGLPGGVGLRKAMPPLRAYVYAERAPGKWPLYAAVAGVIGVPMLIGYAIGRRK